MEFNEVFSLVGHVPYISKSSGKYLYDMILTHKLHNVLELGIAHGTATCYIAAALQELGSGKVTAVDLVEAADTYNPSVTRQLETTGLTQYAEVIRTQTGYNWFLHDKIIQNTKDGVCQEEYDLCIIDGPKNWTIDGAAFFFVDKLLKNGGWIIFDDYLWSYDKADKIRQVTDGITHRALSEGELKRPHVKDIFEYLVVPHQNYSNFIRLNDDWAIAQKVRTPEKTYTVVTKYEKGIKDVVAWGLRKLADRVGAR